MSSKKKASYPQLSLHSAAANGNVGLVKYALSNGQPASSVLNGVLPIHAACSNGNEAIVRMLIENGADINAPRLPRKYSQENRVGGVSIGTSGSTPLHFAAANGHAGIVQLLLDCGARADLTEKHGLTPEAVAESHGHEHVVKILQQWEANGSKPADRADPGSSSNQALPDVPKTAPLPTNTDNTDAQSLRSITSSIANNLKASSGPSKSLGRRRNSSSSMRSALSSSSNVNRGRAAALPPPITPSSTSLESKHRANSGPAVTYSSLTLQRNPSSMSLAMDLRRPSLSSVLDKAAQGKQAIKNVFSFGSPKPPPLQLSESNATAFKLERRPSVSSSIHSTGPKSAFSAIFDRRRANSNELSDGPKSAPVFKDKPKQQDDSDLSELTPSRRYYLANTHSVSPLTTLQSDFPLPSATSAPYEKTTFVVSPPSSTPLPRQSTSYTSVSTAYRPRTSSSLLTAPAVNADTSDAGSTSEAEIFHDAQSELLDTSTEEPAKPKVAPAPAFKPRKKHTKTGSSSSRSSKAEKRLVRQAPEAYVVPKSPPIAEEGPFTLASDQQLTDFGDSRQHDQASELTAPLAATPQVEDDRDATPVAHHIAVGDERLEVFDTVPGAILPPYRSRSHSGTGRLRTDSVGSSGSGASRYSALSPYAVLTPSPLGSINNSAERLGLASGRNEWEFPPFARPRRSGSTSTEPDLRHYVLSSQSSTTGEVPTSASPTSSSSWGSFRPPSAHSTSATSFVPSSYSVRDPPASPRKYGQSIITPSMAHSMVRQAESSLLNFNLDDSATKPSLSEQLAAYSDSLSLEREIASQARSVSSGGRPRHIDVPPPGTNGPYQYERLDPTGARTPLAVPGSSGKPPPLKAYPYKPNSSFQQGVLDVRRPPAPTLRQDTVRPKLPLPVAVSPQAALDSAVNKIYDKRFNALHSHKPSLSSKPASSSASGTSTVSAEEKSDLSNSPDLAGLSDGQGRRKAANKSAASQSAQRRLEPMESSSQVFQLTTPLAPKTSGYETATGVDGLGISTTPSKGKLARALDRMRQ